MTTVTIDLPDDVPTSLRRPGFEPGPDPEGFVATTEEFAQEMRLAAAIFWFSRGRLSQGRAAQVAGLSRLDFLDVLAREKVDVFHVDMDDLREELNRACPPDRGYVSAGLPEPGGVARSAS